MDAVTANLVQSSVLLRQSSERSILLTPNTPRFMRFGSGPQFRLKVRLHSTAFDSLNPRDQFSFPESCLFVLNLPHNRVKFENSDSVSKKKK